MTDSQTTPRLPASRRVGGVELPAPGMWAIDPGHAEVAFIGRHFMLTKVRGRFPGVSGTVTIADDPHQSTVDVTIDMASVQSGSTERDEHLRSPDFFDVAAHPTATFRAQAANWSGPTGELIGELTIKGVSRPVRLAVEYLGTVSDPWGSDRSMFSASGTINRDVWGVTWNMPLASGGLLVSKEIRLEIEIETIRQPDVL